VRPTDEKTLEMNEHQRKAYEQPLGAGPPPPPRHFVHPEVSGGVPLNVSLTADVGPEVADRFGTAGVWHCSVSAWPRSRSSYPIPVERWKLKHREAAEAAIRKNLTGVGREGAEPIREEGGLALHAYLPMNERELDGLGLRYG